MRCNNCGFENAEDATHCIKCKTALDTRTVKQAPRAAEETSAPLPPPPKKETVYGGTILDSQLANLIKQDEPPAATVAGQAPAATVTGQPPATSVTGQAQAVLVQCPHPDCGYPYSSELKVCPRCQREAASAVVATAPPGAPKPFAGTIDPYRTKTIIDTPATPICYLQPIPRQGESGQPATLSFTQPSVELNRDNLDPGNPSITGKVQAELSFDNGAWQLKDKSELQTTFILVSAQTPLKDGDVILLGDRKFIFSTSPLPDK